jgi:outer membrane murein-binding lipoprotein Lpp
MTQSKAKDPIEKQDKLEVMIETLNGKMDKLSTKMMKIWMEELNCEVFNL